MWDRSDPASGTVLARRSSVARDLFLSLFAAQAAIVTVSPVLAEVAADLNVSTATCPTGEFPLSGGFETANVGAASWELKRLVRSGNGWRAFGTSTSGGNSTITTFAYCLGG